MGHITGEQQVELPYSWKLLREKTLANLQKKKYNFCGGNFCRLITHAVLKDSMPPNSAEKTFADSHKTAKFTKVFSLEIFPLYSTTSFYVV